MKRSALAMVLAAWITTPASAQWTRFEQLPATDTWSVEIQGDTVFAGVDLGVWVSTNGGTTWARSANLPVAPVGVEVARLTGGRLWVGTYGKGVFTSTNLGASWTPMNTGLSGGVANSHLYITDFEVRGDSLFASTDGAGVFVIHRKAPVAWALYGTQLVENTAGGVLDLAILGDRLVACAGGNGMVFHRDPGDADWVPGYLNNAGYEPGLQARRTAWTGSAALVSGQTGVYRSAAAVSPWTYVGPNDGSAIDGLVVSRLHKTFLALNSLGSSRYRFSPNDGQTWQALESVSFPTYDLALDATRLFAARQDGLWARTTATLDVPSSGHSVQLQRVGRHPVRDEARLRWLLAKAGHVKLEAFDVNGRRVAVLRDGHHEAGEHEVRWAVADLAPGVYTARLALDDEQSSTRVVVMP